MCAMYKHSTFENTPSCRSRLVCATENVWKNNNKNFARTENLDEQSFSYCLFPYSLGCTNKPARTSWCIFKCKMLVHYMCLKPILRQLTQFWACVPPSYAVRNPLYVHSINSRQEFDTQFVNIIEFECQVILTKKYKRKKIHF